jgi:hypothetical protein
MTAPVPIQLPPDGEGGGYYWDGRAWSPRPRVVWKPPMSSVVIVVVAVLIFIGYSIFGALGGFNGFKRPGEWTPPAPAAAPSASTPTTTQTAKNFLSCKQTDIAGASYYVQLFFSTYAGDICASAQQRFTQEQFEAIPGLTRQCAFNQTGSVGPNHDVVSIYSDGSNGSVAAAKSVCSYNGH